MENINYKKKLRLKREHCKSQEEEGKVKSTKKVDRSCQTGERRELAAKCGIQGNLSRLNGTFSMIIFIL